MDGASWNKQGAPIHDDVRSLIDYCASLGGIFEVAVGTAATDSLAVACGVSIYNDYLSSRFTAVGSTPDEAAASVLMQIKKSASSDDAKH